MYIVQRTIRHCIGITFRAEEVVFVDYSRGGFALCIEVANLFCRAVLDAATSRGGVTFSTTPDNVADRRKTFDRSPARDIAGIIVVVSVAFRS